MVDFGKRPGDMFKEDYDKDDTGVVDGVEELPGHAADHENAGDDEISVAGLSGDLADVQVPKAHLLGSASHTADSLVNLNVKISDGDLDKTTDTRTPASHKASHQNAGNDEISAAGLVGRINLVDRGDPAAVDWAIGDFTLDGGWYDLDCSSLVPAGATAILFRANLRLSTPYVSFYLRKKGNSNSVNVATFMPLIINLFHHATLFCFCDSNRFVEYSGDAGTWLNLNLTVAGYYI